MWQIQASDVQIEAPDWKSSVLDFQLLASCAVCGG
eukprot:CAMPEP_0195123684 /NCGR_PEP_ID=MMETSP0448-20130528/129193_1 /TAXON_ID=66468 /ORGANISM="Heterocapsa triquestra, Strain CCMP 448" /LENGTH=34 /DNA_ID= /DNA_START= /DNA_END= /DNA_ORIENTATION=